MRPKITHLLAFVAAALLIVGAPAQANNDEGDDNRRNGSDDCAHAKAECEDNDFSPTFDKSPVEDSFIFEPTICMPYAHCDGEDPETE